MDQEETKGISFDLPKNRSNVIKVMGVGGGGSNAINYMFQQGIKGVDFIISNTDAQALAESGVPTKIQLGASLTEGLGAGANPEIGAKAAQESHEEIHNVLSTQTKMIFITAGMGGGTGTGAAPIIAQMAKSMDILTVGIVTMPFQFEGKLRLEQAQRGLEKIKSAVDALIVINNNKLREVYGNLGFKAGFAKADEVLATAARGIAEVITHHYTQNIDLKDAKTVLTNSGTAIMGSGTASGSNRAQEAIVKALDSPLLNDNKITGCKNVLLLIVSGSDEITIDEIGEINDYIQTEAGNHTNIIMGVGEDESLGNEVSVTVIATGFGQEQQNEISNTEAKKIIHSLEDEQKVVHDLSDKTMESATMPSNEPEMLQEAPQFERDQPAAPFQNENPLIQMNALLEELEVEYEVVSYTDETVEESETPAFGLNETRLEETPVPEATQFVVSEFEKEEEVESHIPEEPSAEREPEEFVFETNSIEDSTQEEPIELEEEETGEPVLGFELKASFFEEEEVHENREFEAQPLAAESESEFIFNEIEVQDHFQMEVVDPELVAPESQMQMEFEMPLPPKEEADQTAVALDDLEEVPLEDKAVKDFDEAALEIKFEVKSLDDEVKGETPDQESAKEPAAKVENKAGEDPFEQSIEQMLAAQNEKRKEHLKAFNHKFTHHLQRVDDLEKQPAYKRQGLDLDTDLPAAPSRTTLDTDTNDDLQIRSNNSFLHDNVD